MKRINEINQRNRDANKLKDLQATELNEAMLQRMSHAEKLQFNRANGKKMFLSREKLEKNLAEGRLIKMDDGRIMTVNKLHEVEALPENFGKIQNLDISEKKGEIDIERLMTKQRQRLEKQPTLTTTLQQKVEFVGGVAPTSVTERANATVRIQEEDGSWMTLRAANDIVKEMKSKPQVSEQAKAKRTGITVKEYFDRVKKRRVGE